MANIITLHHTTALSGTEKTRTRLVVALFYFLQGICFASWASRIPDIKTALHLSEAGLGTVLLALPAGQLVTLPFSGRIVAHYGSRQVLSVAIVLYALELLVLGMASAQWQLMLGLFFFGVFGNLCNISINTQGVGVEKIYERPIMASFHGAWSTAGVAGALLGILAVSQGLVPRVHFIIISGLVITSSVMANRYLLPGSNPVTEKRPFFSKPNSTLAQLGVIAFCCMAAEGTMFDWSGVYFRQVVQAPPRLVILGYASFMLMMATGRFAGDKVIARLGRKRTLQMSGVLIAAGLLLSVLFPNIVVATLGFLIVGFGVSSVVPTVYSVAGKSSPAVPSMALATVSSIGFLGFLIGPPLIGYIAQALGLQYSFVVIALIGLSISFIVTRVKVMD
jgi:MFS family permease